MNLREASLQGRVIIDGEPVVSTGISTVTHGVLPGRIQGAYNLFSIDDGQWASGHAAQSRTEHVLNIPLVQIPSARGPEC